MHDCLIIGGGVIGFSLAYDLSSHGARVRVIDQSKVAREASWAGAGILPPANLATAVHPLDQLRGLSHHLHPQWAQALHKETGIDTGFRRCGGIYLARTNGEAAALTAYANLLRSEEIKVEELPLGDVVDYEAALGPLVESGDLVTAFRVPGECQLRNPHHLQALIAACKRRHVCIDEQVSLDQLILTRDRLVGLETSCGTMKADRFCIASGAWSGKLLKQFDVSCGIMPVRGQLVMFRCDKPPFQHVLNEGSRYLVPRDDGRVLVGSTEDEVGFDKSTEQLVLEELADFACGIAPALRDAQVERTWAGLRPGSFDGFPYLGAIPGLSNVFVAAGHFRSGLFLSTGTAVVMSQLMRQENPQIDLRPFRVGRG